MTANRKIINATPTEVEGVKFKSRLEASTYKALIDRGFSPQYEPDTFILVPGFKPLRYIKDGEVITRKFTDITYTPDFKVEVENKYTLYIEVKGFPNDVYPYKRKLFLNKLLTAPNVYFLEISTKKGLISSLEKLEILYQDASSR